MTNEEYFKVIGEKIEEIRELREEYRPLAEGLLGGNLYKEDFYFPVALDRGVALIDGMIPMLQIRNIACAGILLRAMIDNCLRIYAPYIAEDKNALMLGYIGGIPISKYKDDTGKKMSDLQLRTRLSERDSLINTVYENSSGFVHFSSKAFSSAVKMTGDNEFVLSIGAPLKEEGNPYLVEIADAFIHYTKLQYSLLYPVVESRKRVDNTANKDGKT